MIDYTVKVYSTGEKAWWLNGKRHREDGPAIEWADGKKEWWLNGKLHREDGPAIEYADGSKYWYLDGKLHRKDGPAMELAGGYKSWYLNDRKVSEKEHKRRTSKTKELTVQEISDLLGYEVKVVR